MRRDRRGGGRARPPASARRWSPARSTSTPATAASCPRSPAGRTSRCSRPVVAQALVEAGVADEEIDAVAATAGPGLVGSLLVGRQRGQGARPRVGRAVRRASTTSRATSTPRSSRSPTSSCRSSCCSCRAGTRCSSTWRTTGATTLLGVDHRRRRRRGLRQGRPVPRARLPRRADHRPAGAPTATPRPSASRARCSTDGDDRPRLQLQRPEDRRRHYVRKHPDVPAADVAAGFQEAVVDVLVTKARRAAQEVGAKGLCLGGGVAANSALAVAAGRGLPGGRHPPVRAEPVDVHRQRGDDRGGRLVAAPVRRSVADGHRRHPQPAPAAGELSAGWSRRPTSPVTALGSTGHARAPCRGGRSRVPTSEPAVPRVPVIGRRAFLAGVAATATAMAAGCGGGDGDDAGPTTTDTAGSTSGGPAMPPVPTSLPADVFRLGVASGDPLPDAVILWTRLVGDPLADGGGMPDADLPVGWEVGRATSVRRRRRLRAPRRPAGGSAHSVHVDATGLEARHLVLVPVPGGRRGRARSAAPAPRRPRTRPSDAAALRLRLVPALPGRLLDRPTPTWPRRTSTSSCSSATTSTRTRATADAVRRTTAPPADDARRLPRPLRRSTRPTPTCRPRTRPPRGSAPGTTTRSRTTTPATSPRRRRRADGVPRPPRRGLPGVVRAHARPRRPARRAPTSASTGRSRYGRPGRVPRARRPPVPQRPAVRRRRATSAPACADAEDADAHDARRRAGGVARRAARRHRRRRGTCSPTRPSCRRCRPLGDTVLNIDQWDGYPAARRRLLEQLPAGRPTRWCVTGDIHASGVGVVTDDPDDPASPAAGHRARGHLDLLDVPGGLPRPGRDRGVGDGVHPIRGTTPARLRRVRRHARRPDRDVPLRGGHRGSDVDGRHRRPVGGDRRGSRGPRPA